MATIQDIKSNAALVKNATGIGENTADRVGGVLTDMTDYLYEKKGELGTDVNAVMSQQAVTKAITNTVNLTDLDFDLSMIGKIMSGGNSCKFVVMQNSKNVGVLHCFGDDSLHMLTQVFTTHYLLPFSNHTHSDEKIFTYFRSYHLTGGTSQLPTGTWGEWKLVYASDNNDRLTDVEASSENLTKNVGLGEYETFSEAKEYPAGYTLLKDGLLYTFKVDHAAGAWNTDEVEDGSLKKEMEKQSNLLGNKAVVKGDFLSIGATTNGYINSDGLYIENSNAILSDYIDVTNLSMLVYTGQMNGSNPNVVWYDDDKNYGGILLKEINNADGTFFNIPNYAKYIRAQSANSLSLQYTKNLSDLINSIENIVYTKDYNALDNIVFTKQFINSKGVISDNAYCNLSDYIPVGYGEKYFLTGQMSAIDPIVWGFDKLKQLTNILVYGDNGQKRIDYLFTIPKDVKFIRVQSINENPILFKGKNINDDVKEIKELVYYISNDILNEVSFTKSEK